MNHRSTLVLGIGNLLRKDDGVGVHVIERLRKETVPPGVMLLDGGTAGIDLLSYFENIDRLIIIDALFGEGVPGEIRVLTEADIRERNIFLSAHYGKLSDLLDMTAELWNRPKTVIIGIIPRDCESYEIGLSTEVEAAAGRCIELIQRMLSKEAHGI